MWFDGWSLIITWGKENTYVDMWPIYLSIVLAYLIHYWGCLRKKAK